LKPNYADAHNNLGTALQKLGKPGEAVASYGMAISIQPDFADAHSNLGNALLALRMLEEAVASYRRALEINPDLSEASGSLGSALLALGKIEEGLEMEEKGFGVISFDTAQGVSINDGSTK